MEALTYAVILILINFVVRKALAQPYSHLIEYGRSQPGQRLLPFFTLPLDQTGVLLKSGATYHEIQSLDHGIYIVMTADRSYKIAK